MVQYAGDNIFEEEETIVTKGEFPKTLSSQLFPKKPELVPLDASSYLLPFLRDPDNPKYSQPSLTDEQIESMYAPSDFRSNKKLALAQFGFGLMRPTEGGKIGASLADAGERLASNLSQIKTAQLAESKQNNAAKITATLQRDAQNLLEQKSLLPLLI